MSTELCILPAADNWLQSVREELLTEYRPQTLVQRLALDRAVLALGRMRSLAQAQAAQMELDQIRDERWADEDRLEPDVLAQAEAEYADACDAQKLTKTKHPTCWALLTDAMGGDLSELKGHPVPVWLGEVNALLAAARATERKLTLSPQARVIQHDAKSLRNIVEVQSTLDTQLAGYLETLAEGGAG